MKGILGSRGLSLPVWSSRLQFRSRSDYDYTLTHGHTHGHTKPHVKVGAPPFSESPLWLSSIEVIFY